LANTHVEIAIIMGSQSDWETMRHAAETLDALGVAYEARIVSAHRTPERLYASRAAPRRQASRSSSPAPVARPTCRACAAAMTPLPVFGVPVESKALSGQDSLLSIVQMPAGIPVGTLAIGRAGAVNAALLAAAVLALERPGTRRIASTPMARRADGQGRRASRTPNDLTVPCPPGSHDRHHRRRPARPHARDGGGEASASAPYRARTAGRLPGRAGRQRADRRVPMTTRRRSPSSWPALRRRHL
jgi:5-(carboxyamino)imidazole ribonucleotide mutase